MKAADSARSQSSGTPVDGSALVGCGAAVGEGVEQRVGERIDAGRGVAAHRAARRFSVCTFGHGVSRLAFDSAHRPRSSRCGRAPSLLAQKQSPCAKSAAIRLKPL